MVLGHVGRVANSIHARCRSIDEAPDAAPARDVNEWLEAIVVDGPAQARVQLEARIVGDAGEVDHGIHSAHDPRDERLIANVSLDGLQRRIHRQDVVAEEEEVDDADPIAGGEQLRYQDCAHIARTACDQDRPARVPHVMPSVLWIPCGSGQTTTMSRWTSRPAERFVPRPPWTDHASDPGG